MKSQRSWVAGAVFGVVFVVSCGEGMQEVVNDMLGVDGFVGDGGLIADATAAPGNPVTCAPGKAFCEGVTLWHCTYTGNDAVLPGDCAAQGTVTNPGVCTTVGCGSSAACCGRQKPIAKWALNEPIVSSGELLHKQQWLLG